MRVDIPYLDNGRSGLPKANSKLLAEQLLLDKKISVIMIKSHDQTDSTTGTRKTKQSWQFKTAQQASMDERTNWSGFE